VPDEVDIDALPIRANPTAEGRRDREKRDLKHKNVEQIRKRQRGRKAARPLKGQQQRYTELRRLAVYRLDQCQMSRLRVSVSLPSN
jgi:hypothetical protein